MSSSADLLLLRLSHSVAALYWSSILAQSLRVVTTQLLRNGQRFTFGKISCLFTSDCWRSVLISPGQRGRMEAKRTRAASITPTYVRLPPWVSRLYILMQSPQTNCPRPLSIRKVCPLPQWHSLRHHLYVRKWRWASPSLCGWDSTRRSP